MEKLFIVEVGDGRDVSEAFSNALDSNHLHHQVYREYPLVECEIGEEVEEFSDFGGTRKEFERVFAFINTQKDKSFNGKLNYVKACLPKKEGVCKFFFFGYVSV